MNPFAVQLEGERPSFGAWFRQWTRSRRYWHLLAGLPSLAALAVILVLAVYVLGWKPARAEVGARAAAERAVQAGDWATARVLYRSLMRLGGKQTQHYAHELMLAQFQLGQVREAVALALELAPTGSQGYAPAHLFVAKSLLAETNLQAAAQDVAINHLHQVLSAEPGNTEARDLLSELYVGRGQWEQAKRHLLELVGSSGPAMLRMATVLGAQGDTSGERYWAERAALYFRGKVESSRVDDSTNRLAWAKALVMLEDFPAAFESLQKAARETGNPVYPPAMVGICTEWAEWLARHRSQDLSTRFRAVQEGLALAPENQRLTMQLATLASLKGPEGERAREIVNRMLQEGRNKGVLHFCLGGEAWARGDKPKAYEHFRQAYAAAPELPSVANNMALVLSWQENPDFERALEIAESLVRKQPGNPIYVETRGQVLALMGRHREALADLIRALPAIEDRTQTHLALAQCYRKLGMPELATEHEQAAAAPAAAR